MRIDCIAAVMSRTIRNIGDLVAIGTFFRHNFIQQVTNSMDHIKVLLLVMATDIVSLTRLTLSDDGVQCAGMIFNIQPVADLIAFAINRQRFTVQGIQNNQRDQLLREVIRAIVVRTVSHNGRETIGAQPCANQMIA
ncbi:hypothetical protein D3C80_1164490 [compost metagenome]